MHISKKMAKTLNEQVRNEFESYWIYQQMAFDLEVMGLKGFATWYTQQAEEERVHGMKICKYLLDQDAKVILADLPKPKNGYKTVLEVAEGALHHEIKITNDINKLMALARSENDFATETFLNWFVQEQVEEVATASDIVTMVKMAPDSQSLLLLESRLTREGDSSAKE